MLLNNFVALVSSMRKSISFLDKFSFAKAQTFTISMKSPDFFRSFQEDVQSGGYSQPLDPSQFLYVILEKSLPEGN